MVGNGIVHMPVRGGIAVPPIVLRVPVGFGEIGPNHHILVAEGLKHILGHIGLGMVGKGAFGDGIVAVLGVIHGKTIMVLGGENHIFHTRFFGGGGPLVGIELSGVEFLIEIPVPLFVSIVVHGAVARNPVFVFRTYRPRLHDAGYGIQTPVDNHAEFEILPLVKVRAHIGLAGRRVLGG